MKQIEQDSPGASFDTESSLTTPKSKVLIVEDDREIANVLQLRLHAAGYCVRTAHDGKRGLAEACVFQPDAMLLDLRMPVMDGITVLKELRQRADLRHLPVIVLSANVDGVSKQKAQDLGARYFLDKPYDAARLLQLVGAVFDEQHRKDASLRSAGCAG